MGSVISPAANLVLDRAEGVRRSGGDTGLYQELMAVFLADVPRLTQLVHVAIAEQSGPGLRLAAHSLRGSASQIGALAVADRASNLEAMGKSADLRDALEQQRLLSEDLRQLILALNGTEPLS